MLALLAGILIAAVLFGVYSAIAVSGVRALERQRRSLSALDTARQTAVGQVGLLAANPEDTAVVDEAVRLLREEHQARLERLQRDCRGVLAIDPGVRRLRSAVCDAIGFDLADLRGGMVGTHPRLDTVLAKELRQWRLDPGQPVSVAPFTAGEAQRAVLRTYSSEFVGNRLVGIQNDRLVRIDIDDSRITPISEERIEHAVMTRTWVAANQRGSVTLFDPSWPDADPVELVMPTTGELVANHDDDTMWVGISDGSYIEVDGTGQVVSPPFDPKAHLAAAGSHYFVTLVGGDDQAPVLTVWDAKTRRVVKEVGQGWGAATRGPFVVWHGDDGRFKSLGYTLAAQPAGIGMSALSANGRVASVVGATDGMQILLTDAERSMSVDVETRRFGFETTLVWSPNGQRVFVTFGRRISYFDGELRRKELRVPSTNLRLIGAL